MQFLSAESIGFVVLLFYWSHSLVKTMHFSARALVMRKNIFIKKFEEDLCGN